MTLSTVIIALVFWSAKKCPSCLAGPLCWSSLSDLGERFQAIRCHLPPRLSSYCPQRERTSEHMMFQSSRDKLEYPGKQICFLLTSFSSDFMSLNSLVLLIFLFFASLPLSGLLLDLMFPFTSCPWLWRAHGISAACAGSAQPRWRAGICAQHAVQTRGCWLCR